MIKIIIKKKYLLVILFQTHRSKHFDLSTGLASRCSLHSCTSNEAVPGVDTSTSSYSTSLSTDTLYWEPHSESSSALPQVVTTKFIKPNVQHYQFIHRHYPHPAQIQPVPSQGYYQQYVQKPKSWDNLTTKSFGGYGFGYGYLDTVSPKQSAITKIHPTVALSQQNNLISKKNSYERYSAFNDVEFHPQPSAQYIQHITQTTTTTTTITAKSTENLIGSYSETNLICDCIESGINSNAVKDVAHKSIAIHPNTQTQAMQEPDKQGYYSNLHVSRSNNPQNGNCISTTSEITKL